MQMPNTNRQVSFSEEQLRNVISKLGPIRAKISVIEADAADKKPPEDIWFDLLFLEDELESILEVRKPTPCLGPDSLSDKRAVTESRD